MNASKRQEIYRRLKEHNPYPTTELRYNTPFELLIAVILSAQSTDIAVNKVTAVLFTTANDARSMHALGIEALSHSFRQLGLYRQKAAHVLASCALLLDKHQGQVPNNRRDLEALPGVGRKTANVVLNTVFGQPTIAVDTHIFRVSNRIPLARGKSVLEVERGLLRHTPAAYRQHAHHWLVLHGRYICMAHKPRCASCLIADLCEYKKKSG